MNRMSGNNKKIMLYACVCEELVRYACESILGCVANENMSTEDLLSKCNVVAFCDKDKDVQAKKYFGKEVIGPSDLSNYEFDTIYILSLSYTDDIFKSLTESYSVSEDKIVRSHVDFIRLARERFVYNAAQFFSDRDSSAFSVAEGGVFKGDFSKVINAAFPNSDLYLFDTFSGFDERDFDSDKNYLNVVNGRKNRYKALADTSVQLVLSKLPYPQKAIIKKGYFPESARDVDGRFAFVNLDFDLYAPIKSGLDFFWEKMERGGIILIHDYFNSSFGVKKAVDEFCTQNSLYPIPIGDLLSVALIKQ